MKCHVIRDLLPEYLEGLCSEETNQEMEEHLSGCKECQSVLNEMQEEKTQQVPKIEAIQPFRKIEKEFKRNRLKKVIAVVLLVLVCGIFGVLSVGQMFPSLSCPSYDSLMYRTWAKEIAKDFVNGNMKDILKAGVENPAYVNVTLRERATLIADVESRLKGYYEKSLKGKEVTIDVDGVSYDSNDTLDGAFVQESLKPEANYLVTLTLKAGGETAKMKIIFANRNQYYLYLEPEKMQTNGRFFTDGITMDEGVDENSWEYNICCMQSWMEYFRQVCRGDTWGKMLLNRWGSQNSRGVVGVDVAADQISYYFTKDCNQYGIRNGETGYTEYSQQVADSFEKIFEKCQGSEFEMIDGVYNEKEKKYNALLFWRVTDLQGKECVLRKDFYYGMTGYEPVDGTEKVFSDEGADPGLVHELGTAFDVSD